MNTSLVYSYAPIQKKRRFAPAFSLAKKRGADRGQNARTCISNARVCFQRVKRVGVEIPTLLRSARSLRLPMIPIIYGFKSLSLRQ